MSSNAKKPKLSRKTGKGKEEEGLDIASFFSYLVVTILAGILCNGHQRRKRRCMKWSDQSEAFFA